MENASKALIIAGAILLSILLISLGIMVFNKAQDISNGSQLDQAEVSTYNSKFTKYEGDKVSGSQVKALINEVNTNNVSDKNNQVIRFITISTEPSTFTLDSTTIGTVNSKNINTYTTAKVFTSAKYKVEVTGYDSNGYVNAIEITKNP